MELTRESPNILSSECFYNSKAEIFPGCIGPLSALWIQLTSACNLRCRYCYADSAERGSRIAPDLVKLLIKDFAAVNGTVVLFGGGEPSIDPNLPDYLKWAHEVFGLRVGVSTNGVTISAALLDALRRCGADVQFSVDTLDRSLFKKLCGRDRLEHVLDNIRRVMEVGIEPTLSMISTRENVNEVSKVVEFALSQGITFLHIGKLVSTGRASCQRDLDDVSFLELWDALYPLQIRYYRHIAIDLIEDFIAPLALNRPRGIFCGAMKHTSLEVTPTGLVTSCGMLPINLFAHGNINDDKPVHIFNRFLAGRSPSYFNAGRLDDCAGCSAWPLCGGGCRAIAYAVSGDPYGKYPYCHQVREIHRRVMIDLSDGQIDNYLEFISNLKQDVVDNSRLF